VRYRGNFLKVLSLLAFVGMPLSAVLSLVSHDAIVLLFGSQWEKSAPIFLAFSLSVGITIVYIAHAWLHLSLGTPDRWFRLGFLELVVTVVCVLVGLRYGGLGVAVAYSASFYILIGPAFWYAGKPVGLTLSPFSPASGSTTRRGSPRESRAGFSCIVRNHIERLPSAESRLSIVVSAGLCLSYT
jgi:O-antigen/teichoic acid export membrane protein